MIKSDIRREMVYKELYENYGEWIELGYSTDEFLISLLIKERDKLSSLEQRIVYLEKKANEIHN